MITKQTSKPFLIFGLPRSRTAWLANALTYGNSRCYHEATVAVQDDLVELKKKLTTGKERHIGAADTSLIYKADKLAKLFEGTPALIIHRDVNEIMRSLYKKRIHVFKEDFIKSLSGRLYSLSTYWPGPVMQLRYDQINEHGFEIWRHLVDGNFDADRWNELCNMKIEMLDKSEYEYLKR